ncbi:MAG: LCP family protein, partial [Clostridia bacterium]|nr:LCP family protein [Clostridia bacterium]
QTRAPAPQARPVRPGTVPQNRAPARQRPIPKSNARELENAHTMAIPAAQLRQYSGANQPAQRPVPPKNRRQKKRRSKKRIAAIVILCLFLAVLLTGGGAMLYGYNLVGNLNYDTDFVDSNAYIDEDALTTNKSVTNILFIGSDERDYDAGITGGRSDTMILCSIDNRHHKVKLTSFLRDAYVTIPSKGSGNRLNAAFSFGGPQLLVDTIEYNFKIKIDGYVLVDFEGFAKMIDLMGGLDVEDVTAAEAKYLKETVKILYAKEGTNHFSGKAALWYCRIRKLDDDFHRTERQRKVIGALAKQAKSMGPVKLLKIVKETLPNFTTSLKQGKVFSTAIFAVIDYLGGDNPQFHIPVDGTWKNATINGAAVLQFDVEENARLLKEFIYE